jgi:hypothetical protein
VKTAEAVRVACQAILKEWREKPDLANSAHWKSMNEDLVEIMNDYTQPYEVRRDATDLWNMVTAEARKIWGPDARPWSRPL